MVLMGAKTVVADGVTLKSVVSDKLPLTQGYFIF